MKEKKISDLQWHPAMYAGLQIEFAEDRDNLIFENEHQLSNMPMEIDVLIVKKNKDIPVKKNIGRIFRKYNIIEYKGPGDSMTIDDFYKAYGYTCFYKSDTGLANEIPAEELTVTMISTAYPEKLIKYLRTKRGFMLKQAGQGIYYVHGDYFPIQIIVTSRLTEEENLWLKSLTNKMKSVESAKKVLNDYNKHRKEKLYKAVMDIVMKANRETFDEAEETLCDALLELMEPHVEKAVSEERAKVTAKVTAEVREQGVKILIETYKNEVKASPEQTREKIAEKYSLTPEEADSYMKKYW